MVFVATALASWLLGRMADVSSRRLRALLLGDEQQRALQQAATAAIMRTAEELCAGTGEQAIELASVVDQVFREPVPTEPLAAHLTMLEALQAGVAAQLAVLGDVGMTGTEKSSAEWLDVQVPSLADGLTRHLVREIVIRGAGGGPLTPLADQLNHDLTHLQARQVSGQLAQIVAGLARLDRFPGGAETASLPGHRVLGRLVCDLDDPFDLEVHPAVKVGAPMTGLAELPSYIPRPHDARLTDLLRRVRQRSTMIVLIGGSSTGKTRALWEAVRTLPEGWRLWHPIYPGLPEAVLDAFTNDQITPRTVIWLNDAQAYLRAPRGDQVAAALRELLRDDSRAPVLVLATLWPDHLPALSAVPGAGSGNKRTPAGALLATAEQIQVPERFTSAELRKLHDAAAGDPRLALAYRRAGGRVTQFLAGSFDLVDRYQRAPAVAHAVISAAVDARRLGHGPRLPRALLEMAAPGYLDDELLENLPGTWFADALDYATAPCRGVPGPLTLVRPRLGAAAPPEPTYRLADYLEQSDRANRSTFIVPGALWDALIAWSGTDDDLTSIAEEAYRRGLRRWAFRLSSAAAQAGKTEVIIGKARQLGSPGNSAAEIDEALRWLRDLAEDGNSDAALATANVLASAGRAEQALSWYRRAGEAGKADFGFAKIKTAARLAGAGRAEEAVAWVKELASAGASGAMAWVARRLVEAGRTQEAVTWLEGFAIAGHTEAMVLAAELLQKMGERERALTWYQRAAEAGDAGAIKSTAVLLTGIGQADEALAWWRRAAETGDTDALRAAASQLDESGRTEEAVGWLQGLVEAGNNHAISVAVEVLTNVNRDDEALAWIRALSETGNRDARRLAVYLTQRLGLTEEAIGWYRRAVQAGDTEFSTRLVSIFCAFKEGQTGQALTWLRAIAEVGDSFALMTAVVSASGLLKELCRMAPDEARIWYRRSLQEKSSLLQLSVLDEEFQIFFLQTAAETGDRGAMMRLAELQAEAGQRQDALNWYQRAAEAGDDRAYVRAANQLHALDRTGEALTLLESLAETGDTDAMHALADLLRALGQTEEPLAWYRKAANAGDELAISRTAGLLDSLGRTEEALSWLRDSGATWLLATRLERLGRTEEALALRRKASDAGNWLALSETAGLLDRLGRTEEALNWLRDKAEGGDMNALRLVTERLENLGRAEEAITWWRIAIESGESDAIVRAAGLLETVGRGAEADRLRRYGIEPGGQTADPW